MADLSYTDLRNATLYKASLSDADLCNANLCDVNLARTSLRGADLDGAKICNSDLRDANLRDANLASAKLNNAYLCVAKIINANLNNVDLSSATIGDTIFANVDFRSVQGLATINHLGPSIVALHSVRLPQDDSAIHFLRGVGIPDESIDFYRATMMHPNQYYSVFISYSSADEQIATRLYTDLQAHGVRCWSAPHNLKPGDYIRKELDQAIHLQDKLLLILSKSAIDSDWVSYEVELALAREIRQKREILFPIRIDHEVLHNTSHWAQTLMETRHIGDFTKWTDPQIYQQAFDRLLQDLKKVAI